MAPPNRRSVLKSLPVIAGLGTAQTGSASSSTDRSVGTKTHIAGVGLTYPDIPEEAAIHHDNFAIFSERSDHIVTGPTVNHNDFKENSFVAIAASSRDSASNSVSPGNAELQTGGLEMQRSSSRVVTTKLGKDYSASQQVRLERSITHPEIRVSPSGDMRMDISGPSVSQKMGPDSTISTKVGEVSLDIRLSTGEMVEIFDERLGDTRKVREHKPTTVKTDVILNARNYGLVDVKSRGDQK